ncbi:MAG TPA: T9SS type A sorting domain-containing protein [Saprospiraceae bacterium]|nr:T9SS type A sorting domain-containing protein [Saprospiraceae bacterium]
MYPNPSLKFFNINLSGISSEYGDIQMRIFDTMGKLVLEKKMLGGGIELLDMQDYPTGIYLVKIIQGSKQFESRISKI